MVKLRLAQLLKQRKMSGYALAKLTGLSLPTVYRLVNADKVTRLEMETLDRLCSALDCKISDLLVRAPDKRE
jgi:putative transcriptional regulator